MRSNRRMRTVLLCAGLAAICITAHSDGDDASARITADGEWEGFVNVRAHITISAPRRSERSQTTVNGAHMSVDSSRAMEDGGPDMWNAV